MEEDSGKYQIGKVNWRITHYSVDENNNYSSELKNDWGAKPIINTELWNALEDRLAAIEEKINEKKTSPITYFMEKSFMDVPMVASYLNFSKWSVKRHMKYKVFLKLKPDVLKKYQELFEVSEEEFTNLLKEKK
jgi:hypothetical protein